jgi:outer membrane protein assembly factor BamB
MIKLPVFVLPLICLCPAAFPNDVLTWHNDNARTGQDLCERVLTPQNVKTATFGKLFKIEADGKVDAEPLYAERLSIPERGVHNVLFIATEHDSVYAVDADSGEPLWNRRLLTDDETPSDNHNCGQVTPEIGITSTPVIDRHRGPHGTMYVVAMSMDSQGHSLQKIHALDISSGGEEFNGPTLIEASYPGTGAASANGTVAFDPAQYAERAALLLVNGVIYTTWTSHCDRAPYTGWIIAYSADTLKRVAVLNITPNGQEGAIWQSGAGPAADPRGFIYLMTGNGTFDTTLDALGFPSRQNFGNSFLKLSARGGRLAIDDYFTMFDVMKENEADGDLGSGGPMVLPDMKDESGRIRQLVIGTGKDRNIYLADRDAMGKFDAQDNRGLYQELPQALKHGFTRPRPAYFDGEVYYGGTGDPLVAFRFRDARLLPEPVSQTSASFGYPGVAPSISAQGSRNGIVWIVENQNFYYAKGSHDAVLHAFDAHDLSHELYNSNQAPNGRDYFGANNKFITPMIANGKVYVGTINGVGVFGLLPKRVP